MRPDLDIKMDVEAELRWSPEIDDTAIIVQVKDGIVTLTGYARSCLEKRFAEGAAKRVLGVAQITDDLAVQLPPCDMLSDAEIARNATAALKLELPLCWEAIQPVVEQREVRLEGTVPWNFQRAKAENAMSKLRGVLRVQNAIRIKEVTTPTEIKRQIEQAFRRNAEVDATHINVEAHGPEVTLSGEVRSWLERDQAQATAWSAPGVRLVKNEIAVRV